MAAATGASLRELMERMGHSSSGAALIYQHATRERYEAIASALDEALAQARRNPRPEPRSDALTGHDGEGEHRDGRIPRKRQHAGLRIHARAGEGNRTLMTS